MSINTIVAVAALNPAQELEAAKLELYTSTGNLTEAQKGQDDSVRRAGLAIGGVFPAFNLYKGNQKGKEQCEGWAGIDALRLEMKERIIEIRKTKYTEAQAKAYFDSTWGAMKDYFAKSLLAPQSSEVVDGAAESGGAKSQKTKAELMVEAVLDARARLDKIIASNEATDKQIKASKYLRMAALLVDNKIIPAELYKEIHDDTAAGAAQAK